MTKEELLQIDNYLLLYKLPLDILIEVKDHMLSQIAEIQISKNLSFEDAFFETKLAWEQDLKPTTFKLFFPEEVPRIVKRLLKEKYNVLFKKAIAVAFISLLINLCFVSISKNAEIYSWFFRIQNSIFIIAPIVLWITNSKIRKFLKNDYKYKGKSFYTIYQQNTNLIIITSGIMIQIVKENGAYIFNYLKTNEPTNIFGFIFMLIGPFLAQTIVIFGILNFNEHKKTLIKIKKYIAE